MTGFEPRTSGIESNRSTNWATTTAQLVKTTYNKFSSLRYLWPHLPSFGLGLSCIRNTTIRINIFLKMGHSQPLFVFYRLSNEKYVHCDILPVTGFEPQISGIWKQQLCQLSHNHCSTFLSRHLLPPFLAPLDVFVLSSISVVTTTAMASTNVGLLPRRNGPVCLSGRPGWIGERQKQTYRLKA